MDEKREGARSLTTKREQITIIRGTPSSRSTIDDPMAIDASVRAAAYLPRRRGLGWARGRSPLLPLAWCYVCMYEMQVSKLKAQQPNCSNKQANSGAACDLMHGRCRVPNCPCMYMNEYE